LYTFRSAVSFALNCLLVFRSTVSVAIWYLYSKAVSVAELGYLYFSTASLVVVDYLYFVSSLSLLTPIFYSQEKINEIQKKKKLIKQNYKFPVLTEYATGENRLLPSSTPCIPLSSSCSPVSNSFSSFSPSNLSFLCFPFSLTPCTSVISPSDSGYDNNSSSEFGLSIPANLFSATAILCTSFLKPCSSPRPSSFLRTSVFHSASVCCFVFLAFDLLAASALAFAHALSASKGL